MDDKSLSQTRENFKVKEVQKGDTWHDRKLTGKVTWKIVPIMSTNYRLTSGNDSPMRGYHMATSHWLIMVYVYENYMGINRGQTCDLP
jgi:hypothetical protein